MLALPSKRTNPLNLVPIFEEFFKKIEGPESLEKYNADIQSLNHLRGTSTPAGATSDNVMIQALLRYHHHLKLLLPRLAGFENDLKLKIVWTDAFNTNKNTQNHNLIFDWGCVIWNLATIESHRGAMQDRNTDEGVRQASLHFQQSAWLFEYLRTDILAKLPTPRSPEFTESCLNMCKNLMLAQAQTCFYEKAVKERKAGSMKPSIIAKLAAQVVAFYSSAADGMRIREVAAIVDSSWLYHMEFQKECFKGLTEYWQSVSQKDEANQNGIGYGKEISRLRKAERFLLLAVRNGKDRKLAHSVIVGAESALTTVQKAKHSAEKDNDSIYHELIPDDATLPEVTPVVMARCTPITEYYTQEKPFFLDLLPKEVKQMNDKFREQLGNRVRDVIGNSTKITNDARSFLSSQGLPGSLELYKSGGILPENLWVKIQRVQSLGGLPELRQKMMAIEHASQRADATIQNILNSLQREENSDRAFRERHPNSGLPKSLGQEDIRINCNALKETLRTANNSDNLIKKDLQDQDFLEYMRILMQPKEEISNMLPRVGQDSAKFGAVNTAKLEELLIKIATLIETREKSSEALQALQPADCTDVFISKHLELASAKDNSNEKRNSIIEEQIAKQLSQIESIISATFAEQNGILEQIRVENEHFVASKANDPLTIERDRVIKLLEQGMSAYFALNSKLTAGNNFYMNLQTRLNALSQQCDDFCYTQQLQRQEIEMELCKNTSKQSQEDLDHEMALKLANQFNASTNISNQPSQANNFQAPPQGPPVSGFQQPPTSGFQQPSRGPPGYVAYGQPISGPPTPNIPPKPQQQQPSPYVPTVGSTPSGPNPGPLPPPAYDSLKPAYVPQTNAYNPNSQPTYPSGPPQNPIPGYGQQYSAPSPSQTQPQYYSNNAIPQNHFPPQPPQNQAPSVQNAQNQYPQYQQPPQQQQVSYQQPQYPPQQPQYLPQQPQQQQAPQYSSQQQYPSVNPGPQYRQTIGVNNPGQPPEEMISQLADMGFPRNIVIQALNQHGNNMDAALNQLLSGGAEQQPPLAGPATTNNNSNETPGIFGRFFK